METIRVPLVGNVTLRGLTASPVVSTKGQFFLNHEFFKFINPYTGKQSFFSQKRPGIKVFGSPSNFSRVDRIWPWWSDNNGGGSHVVTGIDTATGRSRFLLARSGSIYVYTSGTTVISSVEESRSGGNPVLLMNRADTGDYISTDSAATVTAISPPANSIGPMITIKGWTFVANQNGRIYNSNIDDPLTGYTDFITADMFPDGLLTLAKYNDFLVAFGPTSLEFFEVTTNTSGSPLRYRPEFHAAIGITNVSSFVDYSIGNNSLYWSAVGANTAPGSIFYFEGTTPKRLSTPYMHNLNFNGTGPYVIPMGAKEYLVYVISIDSVDHALIYDFEMELWHMWTGATGASTITWSSLGFNADNANLSSLVVYGSTNIGEFVREADGGVFQDFGNAVERRVVTNAVDFGSKDYKVIDYVRLIGDQATSASNVTLSWSDDDGQTFTSGINFDLSKEDPIIRGCGITKRRIFKLSDTLNGEFRYSELEIGYTPCQA